MNPATPSVCLSPPGGRRGCGVPVFSYQVDEAARCVAERVPDHEMAHRLGVTPRTIANYRERLGPWLAGKIEAYEPVSVIGKEIDDLDRMEAALWKALDADTTGKNTVATVKALGSLKDTRHRFLFRVGAVGDADLGTLIERAKDARHQFIHPGKAIRDIIGSMAAAINADAERQDVDDGTEDTETEADQ